MGADSQSDNHPDHHDRDATDDTPILHAAPQAQEGFSDTPDTLETGFEQPEWWYNQRAKRGKHRRYHGHVKRISGTAGERTRRELAATIYDLLVWAKQQTDVAKTDSGEDGGTDDNSE